MAGTQKARALAASLRIANLPSVLSNTLTGAILAALLHEHRDASGLPLAWICAACLYFSGNLLNDWADRAWDAVHRPERALPEGLFQPRSFLLGGILLTLSAWIIAGCVSLPALAVSIVITSFILLYTWLHKRSSWSVIPMALCRALLPVLGFSFTTEHGYRIEWLPVISLMLFAYLVMLSLRARAESKIESNEGSGRWSALGLLLPPTILIAFWLIEARTSASLSLFLLFVGLACIPYGVWTALALTRYRRPVSAQVSALLAGIALIDGLFLLPFVCLHSVFMSSQSCLILSLAWLPAFIAGRLLQRLAPAT